MLPDEAPEHTPQGSDGDARALYRNLVERLPGYVYLDRADGTPVYVSPQVESVLGCTVAEWLGDTRAWVRFVHPDDLAWVDASYEQHRRDRLAWRSQYRVVRPDGEVRWVIDEAAAIFADNGEYVLTQGITMDVTELKTAQVELLHSEQRRRRALTQIVQAETAERARIANDLHDDTIQVMTAALIWLDRAAGSLGRGDSIAVDTAIGEIRRTLGLAMERTRRLAFEMRPQLLHAAGLGPAIRGLAEEVSRQAGFTVSVDVVNERYIEEVETLAYRVVREALVNSRKHSHATHVDVSVGRVGDHLRCLVSDDGRGLPASTAADQLLHFGLDSLREQVELAGGTIRIEGPEGEGVRVCCALPIRPAGRHPLLPVSPSANL